MEKRALIAVILSLLVIFIYQIFFLPPPKKSGEEGEAPPLPETTAPAPIIREALSPPQLVAPVKDEGKRITIDGDLYRLEIDSGGARLRGLDLKRYRTRVEDDSPPIDMVGLSGEEGAVPITFVSEEMKEGDGGVVYTAGRDFVKISGETAVTLVPEAAKKPVRTYTFREGTYVWSVAFDDRGGGKSSVSVVAESGIMANSGRRFRDETSYTEVVAFIDRDVERFSPKKLQTPRFFNEGVHWVGYDNKYFLLALMPPPGSELRVSRVESPGGDRGVILLRLPAGETEISVYAGPKDLDVLSRAGFELERAVNLGWFGSIARPLLALLKWFHGLVGNYGVAIIILTILIKILFYPFTQMSMKSMKRMQSLQPKMVEIKEKYQDDRERMNREIMELYRREKVNPAGGCLPILIQIPIFIALYQALMYSIEIRHAPFVWWINDLSAPENLFSLSLGGFSVPIRLLPLVMGGSMFLQQKLTPQAGDPRQAQIMMFMPIVFTIMFWGFPSGLVLYWLVNNILSILQQVVVNRGTKKEEASPKGPRRRRTP